MANIDLNKYQDFVSKVTSAPSNSLEVMQQELHNLEKSETGVNMSLLLTGSMGLSSETGEFNELVKKAVFQGKPLDWQTHYHMKRELGDIIWYWVNACRALDISPNEVIEENVKKLSNRYPDGEFDVWHSENRHKDDI